MRDEHYPEIPDDFGHWLAGFADGEGCFYIGSRQGSRWLCSFRIRLRFDDAPILEEIQARTGLGRLSRIERRGDANPECSWVVHRKRDIQRLVEVFDAFPLRAKKRRDYVIWREAACYWLALGADPTRRFSVHRGSLAHDWGPMPSLAAELKAGRKYDPALTPAPRPPAPPKALGLF